MRQTPRPAGDRVSCLVNCRAAAAPADALTGTLPRRCVGPAATGWCDLEVGGDRRVRDAPITSRLFGPATGACGRRRDIGGSAEADGVDYLCGVDPCTDRGDPEVAYPSCLRRAGNGIPFVRHLDLVHATGAARPDAAPRPCLYKPAKLVARRSPTIRDHGSLRREMQNRRSPTSTEPSVRTAPALPRGARWAIVGRVSDDVTGKASSPELTLQARVSEVVVRTMKDLYGRGPTHAKTYLCDEYVFCVMSGGLTRDEETMIRGGEQDAVRAYRLRFQSVIAPELIRRVEDVLGRKVVTYHSQVLFDPDRLVEIFVLDPGDDHGARDRELTARSTNY